MDLTKSRFLDVEVNDVYKVCRGDNQVWPIFPDWTPVAGWPTQAQIDALPVGDIRQGHVMAVCEIYISPTKTLFFIAVSLLYNNSNRGKIKIFTFNTETNVIKEQSFSNPDLQVGYAANFYYGKSMAWDKESLSLIVGAPRTLDFKVSGGSGLIRILEAKNSDFVNDNFTFGLKGFHYNYTGTFSTTTNTTNGWIAAENWNSGAGMPTFGWSVALSGNGQSAYVSAPFQHTIIKRDLNYNTEIWEIISVGPGLTNGPDQFYYSMVENGTWTNVFPSWLGVEIFCYDKDPYLGEEYLVARTAKNNGTTFFHNAVAVFQIRQTGKDLEASRIRTLAFPDSVNNSRNATFNWDETSGNVRKTIAGGDNVIVVGTPENGTVYCFRHDTYNSPQDIRDSSPWKTLTFDSCGLAATTTVNTYRKFGSTVAASLKPSLYSIGTFRTTIIVSQVNDFDTGNRGSYSAFKNFGSQSNIPDDLHPYSQDIFERGGLQDFAGYCTFVSSDGTYVISTTPEKTISYSGSTSKQSGQIRIWKKNPRT